MVFAYVLMMASACFAYKKLYKTALVLLALGGVFILFLCFHYMTSTLNVRL